MDIVQLKETPLKKIVELMRNGELPYPPAPVSETGAKYPEFPAALEEIAALAGNRDLPKCINCGITGFHYPADRGYAPGHCYSEAGVIEFTRISGCCEFCFDVMFMENEDE